MQPSEDKIAKLQKSAFNYALYKARNFHTAEEISLEVVSIYLLQYDKIENPEKWIINATKIQCNKHFRLKSRNDSLIDSIHKELDSHISQDYEYDGNFREAFKKSYESLSEDELSTLLFYFNCGRSIKEMLLYTGESYSALRKKISRIKNKIKAKTYQELGYYGSKKIVTPQLNELIRAFLTRFKKHAESDTLQKMFYYFSEVDINRYNLTFDIKTILDYDITIEDSVYNTWVIFIDKNDQPKSFKMSFIIDDKNHLKIISPPELVKSMQVVDVDSPQGKELEKMLSALPEDLSGHPDIPEEELANLFAKIIDKQENP